MWRVSRQVRAIISIAFKFYLFNSNCSIANFPDAPEKNGVAPGVHAATPEMLAKCKEHGARFLTCATDASVMLKGWKAIRAAFPAGEKPAEGGGGYM